MPHFAGDHDPVLPEVTKVVLSDEQFAELKELLRPGYEMAKIMLDDWKRKAAEHEAFVAREAEKAPGESSEKPTH